MALILVEPTVITKRIIISDKESTFSSACEAARKSTTNTK